ncbi:hypothetical protein [Calidifontibacter terrae]
MRARRSGGFFLLTSTLLLSGCASTSPVSTNPSSTPSAITTSAAAEATPSTSVSVGSTADKSNSLAIVPPSGWQTSAPANASSVLGFQAPTASADIYPTFNITRSALVKKATLDSLTTDAMTQLRQTGAKVTPVADRTIGGEPAMGYLIEQTVQQKAVAQTQFFVVHNEQVYVTTLTSSPQGRTEAEAAQNSMFGTWAWTS